MDGESLLTSSGFELKEGRFILIGYKEEVTVVRLWNKLQSKSVSAPSSEVFRVGLDGILGSRIQCKEQQGDWNQVILEVPLQLKPIYDSF